MQCDGQPRSVENGSEKDLAPQVFEAEGMLKGMGEEAHRIRVKGRLRVYAAWRSFP